MLKNVIKVSIGKLQAGLSMYKYAKDERIFAVKFKIFKITFQKIITCKHLNKISNIYM